MWTGGSSRLLCSSSSPSSRCVVVFRTTSSCLPSPSIAASTVAWCCVILGRLSADTASARAAFPSCLGWDTFFFFNLQSLLHVFITITLSGYYHEGRKNVLRLVIHFLISNKTIKNLMLLLVCWIKDACLLNKNRLNLKLAYQHFKTYYSEHWWGIIILMFEKPFKLQRTQRGASNWWPNSVFIVAPGQSRAFVCSCKHKFGQIVP